MDYCDGGDLVNLQACFQNKVYPLNLAIEYLSKVILGLEQLHLQGYLHRDIKPQNILIKNENGKKVIKVADFGFATRATQVTGTVLGTENFMSPEIFKSGVVEQPEEEGELYGYEVDMWAFGVLLYYMLNMTYPFCNSLIIQPLIHTGHFNRNIKSQSNNQIISVTGK